MTIDFELATAYAGPAPTRRTAQRRRRSVTTLRCLACGDSAEVRDVRLVQRAAGLHARTKHDGARASVRAAVTPGV